MTIQYISGKISGDENYRAKFQKAAEPLFGHRSGKHNNTHWLAFMKLPEAT